MVRAFSFLRDLRVDERAHAPVVDEAAGTEHDALFGTVVLANARLVRQVVVAGVDVEDIVFADGDADAAARFILDDFIDDRVLAHDAAALEEVTVQREHHGNAGRNLRGERTDLGVTTLDEGRRRKFTAELADVFKGLEGLEAERMGELRVVEVFPGLERVLEEEFGTVVLDAVSELLGRARDVDPEARDGGVAAEDGHLVDHDDALRAEVDRFVGCARGGNARAHDDNVKRFVPLDVPGFGEFGPGGGSAATEDAQSSKAALEEFAFLHF